MALSPLLLILYLTLPVFLFLFFQNRRTLKNQALPPGPRGLPIIGNLHKLDNSVLHLQLLQLSKKYGPLFSLRLGLRPVVVISSAKLAKETLKNHDLVFCGRPKFVGQQKLSYNGKEMAFSPYSACWREIRKFSVSHILSTSSVSSFSSIRQFEVKQMIKKISSHASSSEVINLHETLISLTITIICRIVLGKRYEDEGVERSRFIRLFNECNALLGTFFVSDYIPFLGWIDRLIGLHARLNKNFKELDQFYQEIIDEHMDSNRKTSEGEDIAGILLQLKKQGAFSMELTYDHIKAVLMVCVFSLFFSFHFLFSILS